MFDEYSGKQKDAFSLFFCITKLNTYLFIQLKLMVQCYNQNTEEENLEFLDFHQKMGKMVAAKLVFIFLL